MIDALAAAIREGLALVLTTLLPVFIVAATAAVMIGLLCAALGIRDAALAQITRALAVVLALALVAEHSAAAFVDFAARAWSGEQLEDR